MTAQKPSSAHTQRVAIIAGDAGNVLRNRIELIAAIAAERHQVTVLVPSLSPGDRALAEHLQQTTAFAIEGFGAASGSFRPAAALETAIAARVRLLSPHVALVTGDVLVSAVRAGRADTEMRIVAHINRLDAVLSDDRMPGWLAGRRLRQAFGAIDVLVAHNREDARQLAGLDLLPATAPVTIVPGAGVDLQRFSAAPLPPLDGGFVVAMVARLDRRSGVIDFCEAAGQVRARHPSVRFLLAGHVPHAADALAREFLARRYPDVEILPADVDLPALLAASHLYVQATWGEGMPRALLMALGRGRPVVATDTPAGRACVDERINGVLTPPRDPEGLAKAIESVLKRPDLLPAMARASRQKAERRFDVHKVTAQMMATLGLGSRAKALVGGV